MDIQKYIMHKREQYNILLEFIEKDEYNDDELQEFPEFIKNFETLKNEGNQEELILFLHLLLNISNNHYRNNNFIEKIERILKFFSQKIKQSMSNSEIFDFFKNNKRILLFLFKNQILIPNKYITDSIICNSDYRLFFSPEIGKDNTIYSQDPDDFEEKRRIGENDSYICSLIRSDSVVEFITYINRNNLSLNKSTIEPSIFETNSFLIDKKVTLIEYATFFGSIQIFNYLKYNVELKPTLWLYAIHSHNAELIHLLEENNVETTDGNYEECLKESIKCHHNDFADYFKDNHLRLTENPLEKIEFVKRLTECSFCYNNYKFFPNNVNQPFLFFNLCRYGYNYLVNNILNLNKNDIERRII